MLRSVRPGFFFCGFIVAGACGEAPAVTDGGASVADGSAGGGQDGPIGDARVERTTDAAISSPPAAPITIFQPALGYATLTALAVDATYVYVTNHRPTPPQPGEFPPTVTAILKDGSAAGALQSGDFADGLTTDGVDVFWSGFTVSNGQTKRYLDKGGFSRPFQRLYEGPSDIPLALATRVGDAEVFSLIRGGSGAIARISKAAGLGAQPAVFGAPFSGSPYFYNPGSLALDATSVYWVDRDAGRVRRIAKSGRGATEEIASGQAPRAIAVDPSGGDVFWLNDEASDGAVMHRDKAGGAPSVMLAGLEHPDAIAVTSTAVFVTTLGAGSATGTVLRIGRADGGVTVLAQGEASPTAIVVDANAVFWIDQGTNAVRRLDL